MSAYDQIKLEPAQMDQIEKINADMRKAIQDQQAKAQKDQARGVPVDRQAMQQTIRKQNEDARVKIDALLTPQQKAQVEQIRNGGGDGLPRGQIYVMRDGKPHRIGVGIGASDGQVTEVTSPNIKVGDLAITSGGPKAKKTAAAGAPGGGPGGPGGGRRGG
jgi:hypothetical protein